MTADRADPTPLITWLRTKSVQPGSGRNQWPMPIHPHWRAAADSQGVTERVDGLFERLIEAEGSNGVLARSTLLSVAATGDFETLHFGALVWGYGDDGRRVAPALRNFTAADPSARQEVCELAGQDPEAAWNRWWQVPKRSAIRGLGVPMGTKLLYFAGFDRSSSLRPLIYDGRVFRSMSALGYTLADPNGRALVTWASDYSAYLRCCAAAADSLGLEPDDVECALFAANGEIS